MRSPLLDSGSSGLPRSDSGSNRAAVLDPAAEEWRKQLLQSSGDSDNEDDVESDDEHDELRSLTSAPPTAFVLKPSKDGFEPVPPKPPTAPVEDWSQYGEVDGGYRRPQQRVLNAVHTLCTRIPYYVPVLSWMPAYKREYFVSDLLAGLTVGVMLVPQGLTYAGLANLPPIYGLYAAFFPLITYVIMGSSRHLSIGPEVTTSILIGKTILEAAKLPEGADPDDDAVQLKYLVPVAMVLSLLVGVFSFLLGIVRLGFLDSILSRPILAGFINAVALTLIAEQANTILGIPHKGGDTPAEALWYALTHLGRTHVLTLLISLFCCMTMFGAGYVKKSVLPNSRIAQCIPDILVVVVLVTLLSYLMDFSGLGVATLNIKETGFRAPSIPRISELGNSFLVTSALTITLLGFVESQLVSKKFASKHGYSMSANRELVALGVCSMVGSFFGAYSAFGSIARTKVSETAGCKTNMTNLIASIVSLISIILILPVFSWTPRAVTASIIFVVAVGLIEWHEMHFIWTVKAWKDMLLSIVMTFVTFVFGVDTGVFFAFASCLLLVVKKTSRPGVTLLGRGYQDDQFGAISELERGVSDIEGCLVYKLEGPLYFANAEKLKDSTRRMERYGGFHVHPSEAPKPMQLSSIIFDMSSLTSVDASALAIMHEIISHYREEGRRVCLVKIPRKVLYKFQLAGILDLVGFENLYKGLDDVFAVLKHENVTNLAHSSQSVSSGRPAAAVNGVMRVEEGDVGGVGSERKEESEVSSNGLTFPHAGP